MERTGSAKTKIKSTIGKELDDFRRHRFMTACVNDEDLYKKLEPYVHFLREDAWGNPLVYPKGAYSVTTGDERKQSGSHYTPKNLTEAIVRETLEPLVYIGPTEGKERAEWQLNHQPNYSTSRFAIRPWVREPSWFKFADGCLND